MSFWLVLLIEHEVLHSYAANAVYRCLVTRQLYLSCGFSSADCRCLQVSNPCQVIHSAAFVHLQHTALTDRDFFNQNRIFLWNFHYYGRPLSVSGRPCYILPMFLFIYLFIFYGRLILRPWWTDARENFTRGGSWVSLEKGQKVTKFGVFSDSIRKLFALTPERGRIL